MARCCSVCLRGTVFGNRVSHSNRKTRRVWRINLHVVTMWKNGKKEKIRKICSRCLRTSMKENRKKKDQMSNLVNSIQQSP